jgi:hypothetical protein
VHYVTAGSAAVGKQNKKEKKKLWLGAHRDVDSKCRTDKRSLPAACPTFTRSTQRNSGRQLGRLRSLG